MEVLLNGMNGLNVLSLAEVVSKGVHELVPIRNQRVTEKTCQEQDAGPADQTSICNPQLCGIDGGFTEWSEWSECSVTCGGGVQRRSRTCTNPKPEGNGKTCQEQDAGPADQTNICNPKLCDVPSCEDPPLDICIVIDKTKSLRARTLPPCWNQ
ncbi:hypothetical protein OS493_014137 [Desmophyllum pertusum]|uniref:Uncharacterized protein n=1 Tax=Desmophyllum pertusum TaxID=174260 RepID=A0A9W9ZDX4_9CNID|nr:hypothetical protein OS493_014137 [Desmophyllum pertusum]